MNDLFAFAICYLNIFFIGISTSTVLLFLNALTNPETDNEWEMANDCCLALCVTFVLSFYFWMNFNLNLLFVIQITPFPFEIKPKLVELAILFYFEIEHFIGKIPISFSFFLFFSHVGWNTTRFFWWSRTRITSLDEPPSTPSLMNKKKINEIKRHAYCNWFAQPWNWNFWPK